MRRAGLARSHGLGHQQGHSPGRSLWGQVRGHRGAAGLRQPRAWTSSWAGDIQVWGGLQRSRGSLLPLMGLRLTDKRSFIRGTLSGRWCVPGLGVCIKQTPSALSWYLGAGGEMGQPSGKTGRHWVHGARGGTRQGAPLTSVGGSPSPLRRQGRPSFPRLRGPLQRTARRPSPTPGAPVLEDRFPKGRVRPKGAHHLRADGPPSSPKAVETVP